jgi:hypothetical protein
MENYFGKSIYLFSGKLLRHKITGQTIKLLKRMFKGGISYQNILSNMGIRFQDKFFNELHTPTNAVNSSCSEIGIYPICDSSWLLCPSQIITAKSARRAGMYLNRESK